MAEVLLYDLPSKGRRACWSLNPWKTRLALNYKGIPYKTQWLEYPEIAPTFKALDIPPNPERTPYTIPTIRIGDKYVMDSRKIADELEKQYPSPPLHLDSPMLPKVEEICSVRGGLAGLLAVFAPKVPGAILNDASRPYWVAAREKQMGMSLADLEKEKGGEKGWETVVPFLKELGNILREKEGPFVLGKTVSYADFVIVACIRMIYRIDTDIYERAVGIEPALKDLYEASKPWVERDDY